MQFTGKYGFSHLLKIGSKNRGVQQIKAKKKDCWAKEGKRLLVQVIASFENSRVGEVVILLYLT